jgi:hypothetical protein
MLGMGTMDRRDLARGLAAQRLGALIASGWSRSLFLGALAVASISVGAGGVLLLWLWAGLGILATVSVCERWRQAASIRQQGGRY